MKESKQEHVQMGVAPSGTFVSGSAEGSSMPPPFQLKSSPLADCQEGTGTVVQRNVDSFDPYDWGEDDSYADEDLEMEGGRMDSWVAEEFLEPLMLGEYEDEGIDYGSLDKEVRGVTKAEFIGSVTDWGNEPVVPHFSFTLWEDEEWWGLETVISSMSLNDGWAPAWGFASRSQTTLAPGTRLDRYGSEYGMYLAKAGASFGGRSLPETHQSRPFHVYEVARPLNIWCGPAIPWYGAPGMEEQFMVKGGQKVMNLLEEGYIREVYNED